VAKRKGIDHVLVLNVLKHESGGNRKAVSSVGARGLMQVMPFHFKSCGISNPNSATQSITCGTGILAEALKEAKGDVGMALAIYNGGGYGKRKFNEGYPCVPYVKGMRNDCLQNKYYVKNIYSAYVGDLKKMGEPT
jgi:soluble lytic murein transglycosylase-like protein